MTDEELKETSSPAEVGEPPAEGEEVDMVEGDMVAGDTVAGDMVASDEPEVEETETLLEQLGTLEDKLVEAEANLADAEKKAAEYLDGWQRAQAAFANFRKRTEAEQTQWRSRANEGLLSRLIPILDDFQRAFEAVPEDYEDDTWLDGIRLVERKLKAILDSENVTAIELESGDMFDPQVHEAVLYQEVDGFEEGQVVAEVERGYMIGDRVLRPALVVVAKGAAKASKPEEEEEAEEGEVVEAAAQEQAGSQSESKEHE